MREAPEGLGGRSPENHPVASYLLNGDIQVSAVAIAAPAARMSTIRPLTSTLTRLSGLGLIQEPPGDNGCQGPFWSLW